MTENIVPDKGQDGHWFVFIDGFQVGELLAYEIDDWPISYGFTLGFFVGNSYATLAEAESALVRTYKSNLPL